MTTRIPCVLLGPNPSQPKFHFKANAASTTPNQRDWGNADPEIHGARRSIGPRLRGVEMIYSQFLCLRKTVALWVPRSTRTVLVSTEREGCQS